jgi:hypothetical protein
MPTHTPYTISNFGRTYTEFHKMNATAANPQATAEDMHNQWENLKPLLSKMLCLAPEGSNEAPDFISENYTGMPSAQTLGLPECVTTTWERMRVLQGLFMHMQMWLFFAASQVALKPRPFAATYYNDTLRDLINQLADLLECCDSLPDSTEDWAFQIIEQCTDETTGK